MVNVTRNLFREDLGRAFLREDFKTDQEKHPWHEFRVSDFEGQEVTQSQVL